MAEVTFNIEVSQVEFLRMVELCQDAGIHVPFYKGSYLTSRKRLLLWLTSNECKRNEDTGAWEIPEELMDEFNALVDDVKSQFIAKNPGLKFEVQSYVDEFI